jgi:predicted  nucleic acid-binding Zn-ribbon protein
MPAKSVDQKLEFIESLVTKLVEEHKQLKKELFAVKIEKKELESKVETQQEEIRYFQNQDKITKIVTSIADGSSNHSELKLMINEYIREIDRCIVHLSE